MTYYAGIDVSLEYSSVCVVDGTGKIVREQRIASEPEALIAWFRGLGFELERIGLEAGPLSQWLYAAMRAEGLAVELYAPCQAATAAEANSVPSTSMRCMITASLRASATFAFFMPARLASRIAQLLRAVQPFSGWVRMMWPAS